MYRLHSNVSLLSPLASLSKSEPVFERFVRLNQHEIDQFSTSNLVSWEDELALIERLLKYTQQPELGLKLGASYRVQDYSVFGYALLSSATVGDAIEFAYRYLGLTFAFFNHSLSYGEEGEAVIQVETKHEYGALYPLLRDRDLVGAFSILKQISGDKFVIKRLELAGGIKLSSQTYFEYFASEVVEGKHDRMYLDRSVLDIPLPAYDPLVREMCEEKCLQMNDEVDDSFSIEMRVREQIILAENTVIKLDEVAAHLGLSGRMLRAYLKERGTSFRAIVRSVRFSIAKKLIQEGNLSIDNIAMKVGYPSTPNFNHAFKRWSDGLSPTDYRRRK